MIGLLAAATEAWSEIKVHRVRVVLSLVGVFLAVFAMTTITAVGNMGRQMLGESFERSAGRPATLRVDAYPNAAPSPEVLARSQAALREAAQRHRATWWGLASQPYGGGAQLPVRFPAGTQLVSTSTVDPSYGTMHRVIVDAGRWFTPDDDAAFAPRLVVNDAFAGRLGGFDPATPPTVVLGGATPVTATVIGTSNPTGSDPAVPTAYLLNSAALRWNLGGDGSTSSPPGLEMWVPDADADALVAALQSEVQASLPGFSVSAYRQDQGADLGVLDVVLAYGVRGIGVFALLLGGIGVLNVGLVTVRQRIREIGVRRSFGATGGRVFFAVLMESVCATFVAGFLAVMASIVLVSNFPLEAVLPPSITLEDVPPFPASAAVEGVLAATLVGALAGLVPATMAVRAKVIDAIRY
ncbi:ABC transporter permease, partial [Kineococcus sp. T13]|uniref:ABC transporter permease n=1 Tax=Kineococcus vitellinus TaxID=2696565 RepID=UPI0014137766|nr:ABC transporter permease [Kineococcus vitellinus]